MKKPLQFILYLLWAVPVLFIGCTKSELAGNSDSTKGDNQVKTTIAYTPCGTPLVAGLYAYGKTDASFGNVTVGNDATKLYVTYELSGGNNIRGAWLYVGTPEGLPPGTISGDGGLFLINDFPYQYFPELSLPEATHTFEISLTGLPECFIVVAIVELKDVIDTSTGELLRVSAKATTGLKCYGYYLEYCKQYCTQGKCETAYAYGNEFANCFLGIAGVTSNNWGWSNGPIVAGTYDWPIYAGAGQCDITKGTLVGNLHVVYAGSTATITYNPLDPGFHFNETHLWVGSDKLPLKKGVFTTAPGQFPYTGSLTYTINSLSGPIYIAAHTEACW